MSGVSVEKILNSVKFDGPDDQVVEFFLNLHIRRYLLSKFHVSNMNTTDFMKGGSAFF